MSGSPRTGLLLAFAAFSFWGLAPIYFKALDHLSAWEITGHRVVWAMLGLGLVLAVRDGLGSLWSTFRQPRHLAWLGLSALLIAANWVTFVWATTNERVLETSLGYFINPLVNVLLGMLFLGERLRRAQWLAVLLAAGATANLVFSLGQLPWVSLTVAFSFGFYGLIRKRLPVGAVTGLYMECLLLAPVALTGLVWMQHNGMAGFVSTDWQTDLLLLTAGPVTIFPLLCFGLAAKRLNLSTIGLMQYLAPTISFLLAVFVYQEVFSLAYKISFVAIWAALAIYSSDMLRHHRQQRRLARQATLAPASGSAEASVEKPKAD
jgi:chloramphenicol-sensitive protein RarD